MANTDDFASLSKGLSSPADKHFAITPSDSTDFDHTTRGIYVGGSGNLVVVDQGGTTCTFTGVLAGVVYPIRAKRVNSTSTTATNLVGLY